MRSHQAVWVAGCSMQVALLCAIDGAVGLSWLGWGAALVWNTGALAWLVHGLRRCGASAPRPADRVTLIRAVLVGGVVGQVVDSYRGSASVPMLVGLSVVALLLDLVDGYVARRTRTASELGARFDMEVDAFLILVLSLYAASTYGGEVLLIGVARYALGAAGIVVPWLRRPVPPRYWRKVVAAVQGVVLTVAAADLLSFGVMLTAILVSMALLAESFGRDVWWLARNRTQRVDSRQQPTMVAAARG